MILDLGRDGRGSGKAVVFTESITTQEYLRSCCSTIGLGDEDITLFRGANDHERAQQALARWQEEEGARFPPGVRPSREVAVRLALVHEFRTRSKVLVCTEAGAKGLNLQFCETVINYDLPWNPQRIEQRIGRCHRYSQQRDVTVVNFIARDNEAHRLTFEILSQKLDLFGRVLDASDHVLHEPRTDAPEIVVSALSVEFESDLRSIYSRSRTLDEVTREIAALRDKISERRDAYEKEYERTSQIIESRFDENVRRVFKRLREDLPDGLADLDRDLADLVDGYLAARGVEYRRSDEAGRVVFDVAPDAALPAEVGDGRRFATGDARALTDAESLNLVHPLVRAAIAHARAWPGGGSVELLLPPDSSPDLAALAGKAGLIRVVLVDYAGFEPVQRLVAAAVVDGAPIDPSLAARIVRLQATDGPAFKVPVDAQWLDDAVDEAVFVDQREVEEGEQKHFEQAIGQLERFVEDKILVCRRERASIAEKLRSARARRDEIVGSTCARSDRGGDRPAGHQGRESRTPDRRIGIQGGRGLQKMARRISRASLPGADRDPAVPGGVPDRRTEPGDVVLRLLHTADWHLGRRFPSFPEEAQKKLSRARMDVIATILDVARRNAVNAVLCVGDMFDDPEPAPDFWEGLARTFQERTRPSSPALPGARQSRSAHAGVGVGARSPVSSAASRVGARRRSR